jgi:hypothetical protein
MSKLVYVKYGFLRVILYNEYHDVVYENKVRLDNKPKIKQLFTDLKSKGVNLKHDNSWF